jgi:hypothetical protein
VTYFENIQKTFLQAEEKRPNFLKTWNVADLSGSVGSININEACQAVLQRPKVQREELTQ